MKTNPNAPINPGTVSHNGYEINESYQNGNTTAMYMGLTKREYFAAMAMQGFSANPVYYSQVSHGNPDYYANKAVELADALIEALNKQ